MSDKQDSGYTSLRITKKLRDALMNIGRKSQSYEDIIWSLMPSEDLPRGPETASDVKAEPKTTIQQEQRKVSAALKNQPAKIAMIKEVWATGERNRAAIARKVEAHPDAVERWIASALKKGDLTE